MSETAHVSVGQTFRKIDPRNGRSSYHLWDTTHHWMYTITDISDDNIYFTNDIGNLVVIDIATFLNSFDPVSEYGKTLPAHQEREELRQRIIELEKRVSQLEAARQQRPQTYRTSPFNTEPDMGAIIPVQKATCKTAWVVV